MILQQLGAYLGLRTLVSCSTLLSCLVFLKYTNQKIASDFLLPNYFCSLFVCLCPACISRFHEYGEGPGTCSQRLFDLFTLHMYIVCVCVSAKLCIYDREGMAHGDYKTK
jgi:hypothetical protein